MSFVAYRAWTVGTQPTVGSQQIVSAPLLADAPYAHEMVLKDLLEDLSHWIAHHRVPVKDLTVRITTEELQDWQVLGDEQA